MRAEDVLIGRDEVVRIHLDRLDELLRTARPGVAEAVQASLSLRFLFDGALNRAAHDHNQPLTIPVPDVEGIPLDQALFFACGGYVLGGVSVAPHYTYREPGRNSPHRAQFDRQVAASPRAHSLREVRLGQFGSQPCLCLLGETLTREATIRYVANKCGGAHHGDDVAKFNRVDRLLTQVGHVLRLNGDGLSAVFLETLGTAWFLLRASSVEALRASLLA